MNRTYELMFIVRPDMTEEDLDKLISTLQSVVPTAGGSVQRVDKMGKRRLAYTVRRFHEGIYVLMVVEGGGPVIHELERRLRVTEPVIKFLTVRVDEEQKRLDKIKKLRDSRSKVKFSLRPSRSLTEPCGQRLEPLRARWKSQRPLRKSADLRIIRHKENRFEENYG